MAEDGDPVDVLVVTPVPLIPGVVVTCRPLGVLKMDDEAGGDNKLLAVPIDKILSIYTQWQKPEDMKMLATLNTLCARLREMRVEQAVQPRIEHFFGGRQTVMGPFPSAGASSSTGSTGAASSGGNNTEEDSVSDSSSDDGSED